MLIRTTFAWPNILVWLVCHTHHIPFLKHRIQKTTTARKTKHTVSPINHCLITLLKSSRWIMQDSQRADKLTIFDAETNVLKQHLRISVTKTNFFEWYDHIWAAKSRRKLSCGDCTGQMVHNQALLTVEAAKHVSNKSLLRRTFHYPS